MTSGEKSSEGGIDSAAKYAAVASSLRKAAKGLPETYTILWVNGQTGQDGTSITAHFSASGATWGEYIRLTPSEVQTIFNAFAESLEKIAGNTLSGSGEIPGSGR